MTNLSQQVRDVVEALRPLLTDWHDCMGHRDTKGERDAIAALAETGGGDA